MKGKNNEIPQKCKKLLIKKVTDIGNAILIFAALMGYIKIAKLLIKIGADIHATNQYGNTSLHLAALNGHTKTVKLLIEKGADISATNQYGNTPLILAAYNGHTETAKFLIEENGADVNAKNNYGISSLHCAANKGHAETAKFLIEKGANVNAQNNEGYKPIHFASHNGHANIVELLFKHPANKVNAQDNKLFNVVKCDNVKDLAQKYEKLFTCNSRNTLNHIISNCIMQIEHLNKIFKKNTKRSDDISKGICQSFSTLASLINLNSKEDFDELYSLMDFEPEELPEKLNEENFKKFLKNELDDKKLKAVFELVQAMVEYSPILEAGNIDECSNCKQQLPKKTLIRYISDNCYDMQSNRIDINKPLVSKILEELKDKDTILYLVSNISKDGSGHAMSITKTYAGQYIFFDSNILRVLELPSEEKVCYVMELAANQYCQIVYPTGLSSFPKIEIIHSTKTTKKVIKHYAREHESGADSYIWDVIAEATKEGIIDPKHQNRSILV